MFWSRRSFELCLACPAQYIECVESLPFPQTSVGMCHATLYHAVTIVYTNDWTKNAYIQRCVVVCKGNKFIISRILSIIICNNDWLVFYVFVCMACECWAYEASKWLCHYHSMLVPKYVYMSQCKLLSISGNEWDVVWESISERDCVGISFIRGWCLLFLVFDCIW